MLVAANTVKSDYNKVKNQGVENKENVLFYYSSALERLNLPESSHVNVKNFCSYLIPDKTSVQMTVSESNKAKHR